MVATEGQAIASGDEVQEIAHRILLEGIEPTASELRLDRGLHCVRKCGGAGSGQTWARAVTGNRRSRLRSVLRIRVEVYAAGGRGRTSAFLGNLGNGRRIGQGRESIMSIYKNPAIKQLKDQQFVSPPRTLGCSRCTAPRRCLTPSNRNASTATPICSRA